MNYLADVGGNQITDKLLHVVVNGTAFFNGSDNGGEVVISQHHLGSGFGDSGTGTHGDTNLSLLQGRGVVHTITSHGRNLIHALQVFNDLGLVSRLHTGEETGSAASFALFILGQIIEFATRIGKAFGGFFFSENTNSSANSFGSGFVITSNDDDADTSLREL